jgi:hypothetical protein
VPGRAGRVRQRSVLFPPNGKHLCRCGVAGHAVAALPRPADRASRIIRARRLTVTRCHSGTLPVGARRRVSLSTNGTTLVDVV